MAHPRNTPEQQAAAKERKRQKSAEYMRKRRAENPEALRENNRRYREAHRAELSRKSVEYAQNHRAQTTARQREWQRDAYAKNPEKFRAYQATHRAKYPEEARAYARQYAKDHPEETRANVKRRRARMRGAPVNDFTHAQWVEMQAAYDHRCVYCGKRVKGHLTQDHIIALINGGSHTLANIVPACRHCNAKKSQGPPLNAVQPLLLTVAPSRMYP